MSPNSRVPVGPGTRVHLKFTLGLPSGETVDSTGDSPATFIVGDGSLLPGFERAMFGMTAGESGRFEISAADGFGEPNEENIQTFARSVFDPDIDLEEGLVVSFADQQRSELPGVVTRVWDERVEVDFNHPLAGKDLIFEVEVVDVIQVSNEIARA
jgi:FKBP-type peptidyl-prolyl cis-trans isomerase SlpA